MDNKIVLEDLENIVSDISIPWEKFRGKTVLITGSTGMLGSLMIKAILYANKKYTLNVKVIACVRDIKKANKILGSFAKDEYLEFRVGDITELMELKEKIHYVVHAASQTSSKGFVNNPVETIKTSVIGTINMLEFAKERSVDGLLYLSTMEVYGAPKTDEKIVEDRLLMVEVESVRSCYPISKIMCENLCISYAAEYGVPTSIARLTQTFGAGVEYDDGRVFAEFARCVVEGRNIILRTRGETKRNYVYTADAIRALLIILLCGQKNGQIYNVANEETYCSITEMANLVSEKCAAKKISVQYEVEDDITKFGYAPVLHMNLDVKKLTEMGWVPNYSLEEMYNRMIECWEIKYK